MGTFSRPAALPHRETVKEKRMNVCELCGERLEIDIESGEQRCPVCDMAGPEE